MPGTGIEVDRLTVAYGDVVAVQQLSFVAPAGQVTCLVGPNGAGKTSTIEALEGLRRPTSGRLSVEGLDPLADHPALVGRIGVMLQEVGIHPAVRVGEVLRHAAALYPRPKATGELLERVGLDGLEQRSFRRLSGGEQRRLALALALVGRPEVAFLDEPTAGVDPAGRLVIRELVAELCGEGVTVLLSSHELDEVERVADRVVMIDDGRLVAEGSLDELTAGAGRSAGESLGGSEQVRFRAQAGLDLRALSGHLAAEVTELSAGEYVVQRAADPRLVAALTAWLAEREITLGDLRAGRESLEDLFFRLTGRRDA